MKRIGLYVVGLMFVLSFAQVAVTGSDSSYDPMADINKDGLIDVDDLNQLGKAYGSSGSVYQEDKAVITVFNETQPVEDALVIVGGETRFTNSYGIADFTLSPGVSYWAIAWTDLAYNYANFTTNSLGEASACIYLGKGVKRLPSHWLAFVIVDKMSGQLKAEVPLWVTGNNLTFYWDGSDYWEWQGGGMHTSISFGFTSSGVLVCQEPGYGTTEPYTRWGVTIWDTSYPDTIIGDAVYMPDKNGNALVVIYV